jgi:DNA mismatch repair protein MSH3
VEDRAQSKELLEAEANIAFQSFLQDICTEHYSLLRDVVSKLAVADCLQSLAQVAKNLGYVRPTFTDDEVIDIKQGRHPVIEVLRSDPFIPNDICLGGSDEEGRGLCKIITGPNMGGKSSTTRMVAIIAVMAQIGSYVPAESLKMGMLDGIMTRMGGELS